MISVLKQRIAAAEASTADGRGVVRRGRSGGRRPEATRRGGRADGGQLEASLTRAGRTRRPRPGPAEPATFAHLGQRVAQILALADEEAKELRDLAQAEVEDARKLADQAAIVRARRGRPVRRAAPPRRRCRRRPDPRRRHGAPPTRSATQPSVTRPRVGRRARPSTSSSVPTPPGPPPTSRPRSPSVATAPPPSSRPSRRPRQSQLDAMARQVEETRAAAQQEQEAAEAQARRIVLRGRTSGPRRLVSEARATAERIRTESERELAAATQRRDSINAQLSNVRQMLATLSGSATGSRRRCAARGRGALDGDRTRTRRRPSRTTRNQRPGDEPD